MLPESRQIENYERTGNSFTSWYKRAEDLLIGADILKAQRDKAIVEYFKAKPDQEILLGLRILSPELMLRGYALECLLKGIWIKRGNSLIRNGRYCKIPNAGDHDLIQLMEINNIGTDEPRKYVLKRLSYYVKSGGRYPVPVRWTDNKIQQNLRGIGPLGHWGSPSDDNTLREIVDLLIKEIET